MSELNFKSELEPSLAEMTRVNIAEWETGLRSLLPSLPDDLSIEVSESPTSGDHGDGDEEWTFGVNGATPTPNSVRIEIDTKTGLEMPELMNDLKATIFHEFFHLARGYSFESTGLTLLDVAIEEGLATKFETIKASSNPRYGKYFDRETMLALLEEVRIADQSGENDWKRWKFYDPETDRHFILYRFGTFIADEFMANNPNMDI